MKCRENEVLLILIVGFAKGVLICLTIMMVMFISAKLLGLLSKEIIIVFLIIIAIVAGTFSAIKDYEEDAKKK